MYSTLANLAAEYSFGQLHSMSVGPLGPSAGILDIPQRPLGRHYKNTLHVEQPYQAQSFPCVVIARNRLNKAAFHVLMETSL